MIVKDPHDEAKMLYKVSSRSHMISKLYGVCDNFPIDKIPSNYRNNFSDKNYAVILKKYERSLRSLMPLIQKNESSQMEIRNGLSIKDALKFSLEIAINLEEVHKDNSVIIRDLKPENCLLDSHNRVILADLGIALKGTRVGGTVAGNSNGFIEGTLHYMPPEAFTSEEFTRSFDVWSLGVCMINLLEGDTEWFQLNFNRINNHLVSERKMPPFSDSYPESLKNLLKKCFTFNPKDRIKVSEVIKELKTVIDEINLL